jgi:hypothetical protein
MKIQIDEDMFDSGGYIKIKSDVESNFVDEVNKKLRDYWVSTGRERNIENAMFEVLAEQYDKNLSINENKNNG